MQKTPQFNLKIVYFWINETKNYSLKIFLVVKKLLVFPFLNKNIFNYYIKIFKGWGQFACRHVFLILCLHQRLNTELVEINSIIVNNDSKFINKCQIKGKKDNFYEWLVGFVEGDGCFSVVKNKGKNGEYKWSLAFKIGQSKYNMRVLYYIKKELGYGSINIESKSNMANFWIRDRETINKVIFPIFDKYQLLTSKYFNYLKFKDAYEIMISKEITKEEKNNFLLSIVNRKKPLDYISPVWEKINNNIEDSNVAKSIISKNWLIGFTEAEGSFYIVKKSSDRLVHAFEIMQKLDSIVLKGIAMILGIKYKVKRTHNTVVTTNSRAIENIIIYYENTMKGMKSLEYKIWCKSYKKYKGNYLELYKMREKMRNMKLINQNKNYNIDYDNIGKKS